MRLRESARWPEAVTGVPESAHGLAGAREGRLLLRNLDAWLLDLARPYVGRRVLDVGCGHGSLTRLLLDREQVVAIDADPASVRVAQARFGGCPNVTALVQDIADPGVRALRRYNLDTAISVNVLEHIADDVAALRHMHAIVAPGGYVVTVAPALFWLYGPIDRAVGHYRRYTIESLRARLEQAGAEPVMHCYVNLPGALAWWVNGRVLRRRGMGAGQLRAFNRLVPVIRHLERRVNPPFGLSVVAVSKAMGRLP